MGDAYWQRGVMLQRQGQNIDALNDLQTALVKRPSRYEAWATIALCYQDLQKPVDAQAAWRKAIAGNDSMAEWHYRLGKLLAGHNNNAAAGPELARAVELADGPDQPAHPWLYDACFLGGVALKSSPTPAGKAKALELFKKFKELAQKDSPYMNEVDKDIAALEPKGRR
jgi:Tfp pilus assembly protein PilF